MGWTNSKPSDIFYSLKSLISDFPSSSKVRAVSEGGDNFYHSSTPQQRISGAGIETERKPKSLSNSSSSSKSSSGKKKKNELTLEWYAIVVLIKWDHYEIIGTLQHLIIT